MKYYKIFAKCCTVPKHIEDVTHKIEEVLDEGIRANLEQWEQEFEFDPEDGRAELEHAFEIYGSLDCGDYMVVAIEDEEELPELTEIPNMIGYEIY